VRSTAAEADRMSGSGGPRPVGLVGSDAPTRVFDVALLDLDGVVYLGDEPVDHASDALATAVEHGMRIAYVTNNALRTPDQVAVKLQGVGVPATADEVVTSAQAAARLVLERCGAGARVLATGGEGLRQALEDAGLEQVASADDRPAAVVLGYDPTLDYPRLAEAGLAARRGALYVACNRDATIPTPRGPMAGMGALAAFVALAAGREPVVAGKPETTLHAESVRRSDARRPVVVGDRLDTDIEGARRAGTPSMLVLTGVTDPRTLAQAAPHERPDLVAPDLRGLLEPHPAAADGRCGDARAHLADGRLVIDAGTGVDALRAGVTAVWAAVDLGRLDVPADADLRVLDQLLR
jgi:glycerol 3-phosphatase-2